MPRGNTVAKGDLVLGNVSGIEAEVLDVQGDILVVSPLGETGERRWSHDVTLIKRAPFVTFATGDTVRANASGVKAEVVCVQADSLVVRPAGEALQRVWSVGDVTLVKRASHPELPIIALTDEERSKIAELLYDAGHLTLASKVAPDGPPAPAVGEWFRSPSGRVYRVENTPSWAANIGRVYFDGCASETTQRVQNEWTKVEVTDV